jgi:hypothetical protein
MLQSTGRVLWATGWCSRQAFVSMPATMRTANTVVQERPWCRFEEEHGPMKPFWVEDARRRPASASYVTIK